MARITVSENTLQYAILAILDLSEGLEAVYDRTTAGVLDGNSRFSQVENAYSFIVNNYQLTKGAISSIRVMAEIIGDALTNEEICILPGAE